MQSILREKLLMHAIDLGQISNSYAKQGNHFVELYLQWLIKTEKDLSKMKSPICIILNAEKSSLCSTLDGFLPDGIKDNRSVRKIQKATAAQSLDRISKEFYSKIDEIDRYFDQMREKLSQAIAVLTIKTDMGDTMSLEDESIKKVWKMLNTLQETRPMYQYLSAKLSSTDAKYLLVDIVQNIMNNRE